MKVAELLQLTMPNIFFSITDLMKRYNLPLAMNTIYECGGMVMSVIELHNKESWYIGM